jgi:RNA-binding protein Musashi
MADPEDGDDLFADLYDADESTNRATSVVEAPKPADPVATSAAPTGDLPGQGIEPVPVSTYESQPAAQSSGFDAGYNSGAGNAYGAPAPTESPVETESHGTGIKEDG